MPKVSVIIPVYGVEKYIERCARSLFEQTLDDMEFIFVDDCTKDNSIQVLEMVITDYPNRKEQIKILHHEHNKGLSHARETGVNAATGEYIAHCDSDDWVEKEMYAELYRSAIAGEYDYVKCSHRKSDGNKTLAIMHPYANSNMSIHDARHYVYHFCGWNSIWDSLVKKDVYERADLEYTDVPMLEDMFVTSQLLNYASSVLLVRKVYYNYFINPDSICRVPGANAVINRTRQAKQNLDKIISRSYKIENSNLTKKDIVVAKWGVKNILIPIMDDKKNRNIWHEIYPELDWQLLFTSKVSIHNKIRYYSAVFNFYKYFKR